MENEIELLDSQNEQEVEETSNVEPDAEPEVDVEALKEQNKKLFARAKRAEGFVLVNGKWIKQEKPTPKLEETSKNDSLSAKDIIAIRDLHEEDAEYLINEAKLRGKTVSEMKKDPYMAIILKTKAEERKTAEATNTGGSKRQSSPVTAEQIVSSAMEGKEVDPVKYAMAQMELKKRKKS